MVYVGTHDCYENINIKLWSTISKLKPRHVDIFCYKKKMIVKFNYVFQLEINEWLLLSAFQQGLQQKLVFILTQENGFS